MPSLKPNSVEWNIVLHNITDAGFNSPCYVFRNVSITILNSEAQLFLFKSFHIKTRFQETVVFKIVLNVVSFAEIER